MKKWVQLSSSLLAITFLLVSCSSQQTTERNVASQSCMNSIKPEYQSYFDSVEKCLEKTPN
jgi:uncharacterized protein YcfL